MKHYTTTIEYSSEAYSEKLANDIVRHALQSHTDAVIESISTQERYDAD